ncbi:MAG TPA: ribonuclease R [Lentisphaeria bacterium]|nr:ribonuclease R [Lentisphaeria bacterium]|tara:strand:- start:2127 stop:4397 length:2271 start_codon:yes stop_codon:yes gene_type:complete
MSKNKKKKNALQKDLPISRANVIAVLDAPDYQPLNLAGMLEALSLPAESADALANLIGGMIDDGIVVKLKHKGFARTTDADLLIGSISFTKTGHAFVAEANSTREVFVPSGRTHTALPGDKVLVRIDRRGRRQQPDKLAEGDVIRVLERNCRSIVGTLRKATKWFYVEPMQASFKHDVMVPGKGGARLGDRVLVSLNDWEDPRQSPGGEIIDVIGPADDPSLDTLSVIKAFNLPEAFPPQVVEQAQSARIPKKEIERRRDLRKKFIFTIDPKDAKDFDDAISLEKARDGNWRLGVHIADVSYFVSRDSELDREATKRGTSVYLPDTVIPMLPEQLSNGLCSLRPDEDRLAFSVFMTINREGEILRTTFAETVIRSQLRLSYEQALSALDGDQKAISAVPGLAKRVELLQQANTVAGALRRRRFSTGALEMHIPEVKFKIGSDGRIKDIILLTTDKAHQLIEEFMLAANEAVCRELTKRGRLLIHRIHEEPDPEKLANLEETLQMAGFEAGDLTLRRNLQHVLREIDRTNQGHAWNGAVLRAFKRAQYSAQCVGHYGLGKSHYCHFTSPIRRYPDLIVHRVLKALANRGKPPYSREQLTETALASSRCEDKAVEAEREIVDMKKIRFFAEQLEGGDLEEYDAVVIDVRNFGVFIFIPAVQAQGMIHVSELRDDFFDFNPVRMELKGRRSGESYSIGTPVKVVIAKVDVERRLMDFFPVRPAAEQAKKPTRTSGRPPIRPGKKERGRSKSRQRGGRRH